LKEKIKLPPKRVKLKDLFFSLILFYPIRKFLSTMD